MVLGQCTIILREKGGGITKVAETTTTIVAKTIIVITITISITLIVMIMMTMGTETGAARAVTDGRARVARIGELMTEASRTNARIAITTTAAANKTITSQPTILKNSKRRTFHALTRRIFPPSPQTERRKK